MKIKTELQDTIFLLSTIKVNSLEERTTYIYYKRSTYNGQNDPCGNELYRMKKEGVVWTKLDDIICPDDKQLWELSWPNNYN